MPLVKTSITALFRCIDDFAKTFEDREQKRLIDTGRQRLRSGKLPLSRMLFIMVLFHGSACKDFKHFRLHGVEIEYRNCSGDLPGYGRFVTLMPRLPVPLCVLLHCFRGGLFCRQHRAGGVSQHPDRSQQGVQRVGQARPEHHGLAAHGH